MPRWAHISLKDRIKGLWSKVDKSPGQGPKGNCWQWLGPIDADGYGIHTNLINGERRVNRCVYKLKYPKRRINKLDVCHHCDNPPCCRPSHLFSGTREANMQDCVNKGRHRYGLQQGSKNGFAKLTETKVRKIFVLRAKGLTYQRIGDLFGVRRSCIWEVCIGKRWKHVKHKKAA